MLIRRRITAGILAAVLLTPAFGGEEARLRANWRSLQEKQIDLLPVPKHLNVLPARRISGIALSGLPGAKFRTAIIEEIESRLRELESPVRLQCAAEPVAGAFNIILKPWNGNTEESAKIPFNADSRFEQAYTLSPMENGIVLRGKGDAGLLYAAVTLRALIVREGEKIMIHAASVADWPDFAVRRIGLRSILFGQAKWNDGEQCLLLMKQALKWALRNKINAVAHLPYQPPYGAMRLNAKPPYYSPRAAQLMKRITEYAAANGIAAGRAKGTMTLAWQTNETDAGDPRFKKLMLYNRGRLTTWAHPEWFAETAGRLTEFYKQSGFAFYNFHSVDGGAANDPEFWSRRDDATKARFGSDRVQADIAVLREIHRCFQGLNVDFSYSQYPYCGYFLTEEGIRRTLHLPDTAAASEYARETAQLNRNYLKRLDRELAPDISLCFREGTAEEMKTGYATCPERPLWLYWEVLNINRDVVPLLSPEIAMTKSAFQSPRKGELKLWLSDDYEFWEQCKVLFAEFAWNRNFPGNRDFSRKDSPVSYPADFLRTLARRAAEGLWGMKHGPALAPLFDDMLSLAYAYDPAGFRKARVWSPMEDLPYLKRNHKALLRAEKAADALFAEMKGAPEKQRGFKPGSYPYFLDLLRMLKGGVLYSGVNIASQELEDLAKRGEIRRCTEYYAEAQKQLQAGKRKYLREMADLKNAPSRTDFRHFNKKWILEGSYYRFVRMLQPDLKELEKRLEASYEKRGSIFAAHNIPAWYERHFRRYTFRRIACHAEDTPWKHFFGHKTIKPAPEPVEFRIRRDGNALIFSGTVARKDPGAYSGKAVTYREWPKGDSAGIHLQIPPVSGKQTAYQIVVGSSGGAFVCRHDTDRNGVRTRTPVDLKLAPEVKRNPDGWEFQVKIPFASLNANPGKGWKILLEYNRGSEPYASSFANGRKFTDPSFWQTLVFGKLDKPAGADFLMKANEISLEETTHTDGSGTLVAFRPALETTVPVQVRNFTCTVRDEKGQALSPTTPLLKDVFLSACWNASEPVRCQLQVSHPGVMLDFQLVYQENGREKRTSRKIFTGKITVPGGKLPDGSPSLRTPFSVKEKITQKKGALALSFLPDWNDSSSPPPEDRILFHCGPQLRQGSFRLRNIMLVRYNPGTGYFYFCINNGKSVEICARPEKWDRKSWLDLAVAWDMRGAVPEMEIYFNGKKAVPQRMNKTRFQEKFEPVRMLYEPYFGALNSGERPADGAIGNVRIWQEPSAMTRGEKADFQVIMKDARNERK